VLPYEIVVVDDACDETTRDVVSKYARRSAVPIRYVENRNGDGPSGSRNLGAKVAVGDALAFLDDDDAWKCDYLEQVTRLIDEADVVVTPLITVFLDRSGREVRRKARRLNARTVHRVVDRVWGVTGSNIAIHRQVFEFSGGYDEELWIGEDFELFSRLLARGARVVVASGPQAIQIAHAGRRLTGHPQGKVDGLRVLIRKAYARSSPRGKRVLAARYFDAKRAATHDRIGRRRYWMYSWSYRIEARLVAVVPQRSSFVSRRADV
jgi:glycosyltransferase involved in cell wall biosynthesis